MNAALTEESGTSGTLLTPQKFSTADITDALVVGWRSFRAMPAASMAFASLFALIGLVLLAALGGFGISPMVLPFAGGFMLVGPALLTGFFRLAVIHANGGKPRLFDAFAAFVHAPAGLWLVALLCAFLFLIWITDEAILYTVMIGGDHHDLAWLINLQGRAVAFELWGMLMGSVLAFIILAVSAFSVPLLHEHRASLVQAVTKPNIGWPTYLDGTVGSRDAAVERTGRYSQRVPSRYVGYLMYSLVMPVSALYSVTF